MPFVMQLNLYLTLAHMKTITTMRLLKCSKVHPYVLCTFSQVSYVCMFQRFVIVSEFINIALNLSYFISKARIMVAHKSEDAD